MSDKDLSERSSIFIAVTTKLATSQMLSSFSLFFDSSSFRFFYFFSVYPSVREKNSFVCCYSILLQFFLWNEHFSCCKLFFFLLFSTHMFTILLLKRLTVRWDITIDFDHSHTTFVTQLTLIAKNCIEIVISAHKIKKYKQFHAGVHACGFFMTHRQHTFIYLLFKIKLLLKWTQEVSEMSI